MGGTQISRCKTNHLSNPRAGSSVVEHLVYIQKVLGSNPSLATFMQYNRLWVLRK